MGSYIVHKINGNSVAVVYDLNNTKSLYMRVKNTGQVGWEKKSSGTSDLNKAKNLALSWWHEREAGLKAGFQLVGKPFKKAAEEFLDNYKTLAETGFEKYALSTYKEKLALVNRYFMPFFNDTAIDRIGKTGIEEYLKWRMAYWEKRIAAGDNVIQYTRGGKTLSRNVKEGRPSPATVKRENATLKQIFDYAVDQGWLSSDKKPKILNIGTKTAKRPAFKRVEIDKVIAAAIERTIVRYKSSPKYEHYGKMIISPTLSKIPTKIHYHRQQLLLYIMFIYFTGIRPGEEANYIKWKDVTEEKDSTLTKTVRCIIVNTEREGKTEGSKRTVVPIGKLWIYLDEYRKSYAIYCTDDDYIFADYYTGDIIHSFKKAFYNLIKSIGLTHSSHGLPYCLYSLRHSYASHNIKNMGAWLVAKNMGHSDVRMLEKHYAQESTVDWYED